jgi:hypothetical protein
MTKNSPSSASEELLSVPGEKLGIVGSAPSFVSASGEPFLWSEKPMLVKKIVRNETPVALVVHETRSGKFSDSWVRWSVNGPEVVTAPNGEEFLIAADEPLVVAVGANVEGADFEEMDEVDFEEMDEGGGDSPKTGATLRGIALIPSKGEKFLTLNVESPLICDKNDVFSTTQQDGDFRLVRMVANSERYLAVRVGNEWKIAYGPGNARVSVMPGFPFSSGWGFVKHDQLDYACQYRNGKFEEVSTLEF